HRLGGGIGNVVELEVEKHLEIPRHQLFDQGRPFAGEQLLAHLEPAQTGIEGRRQVQGIRATGKIEGDNDGWGIFLHDRSNSAIYGEIGNGTDRGAISRRAVRATEGAPRGADATAGARWPTGR